LFPVPTVANLSRLSAADLCTLREAQGQGRERSGASQKALTLRVRVLGCARTGGAGKSEYLGVDMTDQFSKGKLMCGAELAQGREPVRELSAGGMPAPVQRRGLS